MPRTSFRWALPGLLAMMCAAPAAAQSGQDKLYIRSLAATCANCHGTDGAAAAGQPMPRLAGLQASYISEQMQAFRDGKRPATVMHQLAKGYTDEQITAIAAFFAAQPK
jgi:cytochrome subunit of sulfide dehydrogenase